MISPSETRSTAGPEARLHLCTMIADHFERELKQPMEGPEVPTRFS
jgi:hypothetical protein